MSRVQQQSIDSAGTSFIANERPKTFGRYHDDGGGDDESDDDDFAVNNNSNHNNRTPARSTESQLAEASTTTD